MNIIDFPSAGAQASIDASSVVPGVVTSLTLFTQFTLSFPNRIEMVLTPPPASGVGPIILIDDSSVTTGGTYATAWTPLSTPALGSLIAIQTSDIAGSWLLTITDTDDTAGPGFSVGTLESFQLDLTVVDCGDGAIEPGEQCDDGNTANGDCCSSTCQYEANGSLCPSDGDVCTDDVCDGAGTCGVFNTAPCDDLNACTNPDACDGAGTCQGGPAVDCDDNNICTQDSCDMGTGCVYDNAPVMDCKPADKSILLLKNNDDNTKDKLLWKWLKGAETTLGDLGTPTGTANYTLCLYAGTTSVSVTMPGGSSWQPLGSKGFKYKDTALSSDGAQKAVLKSGATGKAKALVKGKGDNLPDELVPALPLPVVAQLVNDENSTCFEAIYDTGEVINNDENQFKAKVQE